MSNPAVFQVLLTARLDRDFLVIARQRLVDSLQLLQRKAAVVVRIGSFGVYLQGKVDLPDRLYMVAPLSINDTDQMQTIKMIGLHFQDLSINLLSFCQSTSLMKRQRLAEC